MLRKTFLAICLFVFLGIFAQSAFSFDDGDFQYWSAVKSSWKIDDNWKVGLEEEFRLGDNGGNLYYQHSDLGFTYSGVASWLDLGINYRHIFEKSSGKWYEENRPHLNANLKIKAKDWKLSNRSRFEYRNKERGDDYWRYRNKVTVKFPWKFTSAKIQPYFADEFFVDFDKEELNRNRIYAGFTFKITKNIKGDIFHLFQRSKSGGKWKNTNVLGTKIKLSF